jgi:hypothetical protein
MTPGEERFRRARRNKSMHVYHGEPRPKGYRTVKLQSRFPSQALLRAIAELGFPAGAIISGMYWDKDNNVRGRLNDRRRRSAGENYDDDRRPVNINQAGIPIVLRGESEGYADMPCDPVHPFIPPAPSRRTTQAPTAKKHPDGYPLNWAKKNRDTILGCIMYAAMQAAIAECVFRERRPEDVSQETGIKLGRLRSAVKRARKRMEREYERQFGVKVNKSNTVSGPDPGLYNYEKGAS